MRIAAALLAAIALVAGPALAQSPPKPSALVTLVAQTGVVTDCPDGGYGFALQGADGNFSAFTIPNKKVLVVTSFEWNGSGATADRYNVVTLSSQATGSESQMLARGSALADGAGIFAGSHVVPSGVAVSAGRTVCLQISGIPLAVLHGYLAKAK